jgi:hypothetical protein
MIEAAKALIGAARRALDAGATTAAEIKDMQRVEIWLARLIADQDRLEHRHDDGDGDRGKGKGKPGR